MAPCWPRALHPLSGLQCCLAALFIWVAVAADTPPQSGTRFLQASRTRLRFGRLRGPGAAEDNDNTSSAAKLARNLSEALGATLTTNTSDESRFAASMTAKRTSNSSETSALGVAPVDDWYEKEKAKIDKECEEMRKTLDDTYKRRLQERVQAAKTKKDEKEKELDEAKKKLTEEKKHLVKEQYHEETERRKAAEHQAGVDATEDVIDDSEAKIKELEKLIEEKQKCIEELHEAEKELAEYEAKLQKVKDDVDAKKKKADEERAEEKRRLEKQQAAVAAADEELLEAQANAAIAEKKLAEARAKRDAVVKKERQEETVVAAKDGFFAKINEGSRQQSKVGVESKERSHLVKRSAGHVARFGFGKVGKSIEGDSWQESKSHVDSERRTFTVSARFSE